MQSPCKIIAESKSNCSHSCLIAPEQSEIYNYLFMTNITEKFHDFSRVKTKFNIINLQQIKPKHCEYNMRYLTFK